MLMARRRIPRGKYLILFNSYLYTVKSIYRRKLPSGKHVVYLRFNETNEQYKCGGNTYLSKTDSEMLIIEEKIRQTKIGNKNPNAKSIKCRNINTLEELYFDTMKECQEYFGETNHQFISRRCLGKLKNLYQKHLAKQ